MDQSRQQDGAGAALIAFVVVILLVVAVASYYWVSRRAIVQRQLEAERASAAAAAEVARQLAQNARSSSTPVESGLSDNVEGEIRAVLDQQLKAWNAGNVEAFMEHYWKSNDLTFSSGGKVTRGWQATLDGYKQRYPSREAMGQTAFENLEITPLGPGAAMVLGDWRLTRESGDIGGKFTLVFRNLDGRWLIVHDHTSRADSP